MNFRPSRLIAGVEDSLALIASRVARNASTYAHGVRMEYKARQLAAHINDLNEQAIKVAQLSDDDLAVFAREQEQIVCRAMQLAKKRRAPSARGS